MLKRIFFIIIIVLPFWGYSQVQISALNWPGKRSDWINVKTDVTPKAIGDGLADDYAAIQAALDIINARTPPEKPRTVYFPPGTYRITQTLLLKKVNGGCWLVGHGRNTTIVWAGERGGTMLLLDGTPRSLFEGIVFDGNNIAGIGLDHYSSTLFVTESDHKYLNFKNMQTGIRFGNNKRASAEQSVQNCLFNNCSRGILVQTFNNYDIVVVASNFYNCGIGICLGKANIYVRNCHFENSSESDITAIRGPEHPCSFIRCTSVNSNKFLDWNGGVSTAFIQNCHVSGWKSNAAISIQGPPCVIFDCVFTNPPSANPPISTINNPHLILSNNLFVGTSKLFGNTKYFTEIPKGRLDGAVLSATQSFFSEEVCVPQKVYDVKAFGAKGDGKSDDYAAIQAAIDSARSYGYGAIAYLPKGDYKVCNSLIVTGVNYTVGGCIPGGGPVGSIIQWGGAVGGITMKIINPKNITIEQLAVYDSKKGSVDIQQTGTKANSSIVYDMVTVYGEYQNNSLKGLQFLNLPKGATVIANHMVGNVRATNSSRAKILINFKWQGTLTVEGATERDRDGFMGIQAMLATNVPYGIYVKDNQNLIVTNFYSEQADRYVSIEGNGVNTNGHVTIAGVKIQTALQPQINIDNYKGRVAGISLQHYQAPDPRLIVQTGIQPVKLLWMGNNGYNPTIIFNTSPTGKLVFIENTWKGPADTIAGGDLQVASDVLDDFREMGINDLLLNYNFNCPKSVTVTGVKVSPVSATLQVGTAMQISASVEPQNASNNNYIWISGNENIATVSSSGVVIGIKAGKVKIKVKTADGNKTATCTVTVLAKSSNAQ